MNVPSPKPHLLEMLHVTVGRFHQPDLVSVRNVTWQIAEGEFWVIAGPQGSGRSDLLLTAAGLLRPRSGLIRWFGQPPPQTETARQALRRKIGFVFEHGHLLADLTVAENLALPLEYHGLASATSARQAVLAMLESTGLGPWAAARPSLLPVPWQKRALLARALMLQPELLFLDCPLRGLDRRHTDWWHETLLKLHRGSFPALPRPVTVAFTAEEPPAWDLPRYALAWLEQEEFRLLADPGQNTSRSS